jgi:hypothetical protein
MRFVVAAVYAAMAVPSIFLVLAWRNLLRSTSERPRAVLRVTVIAATASYLWLLAVLIFGSVVAPSYSDLRFGTIYFNMVCMAMGFASRYGREVR